jgi:hypothetical protein
MLGYYQVATKLVASRIVLISIELVAYWRFFGFKKEAEQFLVLSFKDTVLGFMDFLNFLI